jgi:hypothetical protein
MKYDSVFFGVSSIQTSRFNSNIFDGLDVYFSATPTIPKEPYTIAPIIASPSINLKQYEMCNPFIFFE